ncbi:potassium-transporting ATPase subunit KdpC [Vogesella sp. LYT5W]|uniref:Potassium-transporting ATPase KdpC subunit n=1 Tax=Vogesella margarita TaxID=2984199 RepID=A0ABT5IS53_9NEIS|nr:potassium-transporting ATPase subunit KdpC [Vogesella margarita]MDC7715403.1 potassium-transporting ATPase subunit KdpC [Vogesella margarita]
MAMTTYHPASALSLPRAAVLRPALTLLLFLILVLGLLYPLAVTGLAQLLLPAQANGSLLRDNHGRVIGSALIGQAFHSRGEFWSRPSATAGSAYNGGASGGSNLGPSNPALTKVVAERIAALRAAHPEQRGPVPLDLVTASASGLDPHISLAAALYQAPRVARELKRPLPQVEALIAAQREQGWFGNAQQARVNVLQLNLALRRLAAG